MACLSESLQSRVPLAIFSWARLGLIDSLLLITSQSEPTVSSGWLIGSSVTKAQGWGGWLFVLCDGSRIGLFSPVLQAPFDKSSQFISRDHVADVDFNDVSVYMEIN